MRRRTLGLALSAILAPSLSYAVGLGEISTYSALNQPLNAQIEMVSTTPGEVGEVTVRLAPDAVFEQVGIARSSVLNKLKFNPTVVNGVPVIKVSSDAPIQEPFVNFIVEVAWPKGKLLREYTVLLDPPVLGGGAAAPATATATTSVQDMPVFVAEPETAEATPVEPMETAEVEVIADDQGLPPFSGEAPADVETFPLETAAEEAPVIAEMEEVQMVEEPDLYPVETETVVPETTAFAEPANTEGWLPPFVDGEFNVASAEIETYPVSEPVEGGSEVFTEAPVSSTETFTDTDAYVASGETYEVNRGDTLFRISKQASEGTGANIHQMMVAIQRSNPKAFIRNDMNRLKAGYILRIPDAGEAASISRAEAKAAVMSAIAAKSQGGAFQEYKSQAAKVAVPQAEVDEGGSVAGIADLESRVKNVAPEEVTGVTGEKAELEILTPEEKGGSAGGGEAGEGQGAAGISAELAKEKLESKVQESEELQSRVSELESLITDKDRLIELKDEKLADLQTDVSGEGATTEAADSEESGKAEEPAPEATEVAAADESAESASSGGLLQESDAAVEEAETPQEGLTESEKLAEAEAEAEPIAEVSDSTATEVGEEAGEAEPVDEQLEATAEAETTEEAEETTGLIESFKKNPGALAGVGAGVLLMSALAWLIFRKKEDEVVVVDHIDEEGHEDAIPEEETAVAIGDELHEEDEAARTTEISSDEIEIEKVNTQLEAEMPQLEPQEAGTLAGAAQGADEGDEDEVLSEANVYLAYGLHDQAIDLLKPAVEAHPERNDYIAKLAEAYHATHDKDAFLATAKKMQGTAEGPDRNLFQRVAVMGRDIAPEHEMFANVDVGDLTLTAITRRPDALEETGAAETMAIDSEDLAELTPDDTQLPDLDELSKSLQMEESEALKELRESALADEAQADVDSLDVTNVHIPAPDFSEMPDDAKEGLSDLSSVPDESVAEFDSKTLSLAMADQGDDLSLDELEDDFNSLTTGADEMSTKLDLAKAYIDMGDDEGAREALEEVISNGSPEQQGAAKSLLSQLK